MSEPLPYRVPAFLDFEASSLSSSSYPIEVAWSLEDGTVECHLISPAGIEKWTDWSHKAEGLHGISRDQLLAHGKSPSSVCRMMNEQLAGKVVYVEDLSFDGMWLAELFSVSWGQQPKVVLRGLDELLMPVIRPSGQPLAQRQTRICELKDAARRQCGKGHRARADVEYLITLWRLAVEAST